MDEDGVAEASNYVGLSRSALPANMIRTSH